MVIDRCNRACDHQKALSNGHHDCQYLHITTTLLILILLQLFLKQSLPYIEIANQIYNKNIVQAIRDMEMKSNKPEVLEIYNGKVNFNVLDR